jgi:hypothetical protein
MDPVLSSEAAHILPWECRFIIVDNRIGAAIDEINFCERDSRRERDFQGTGNEGLD